MIKKKKILSLLLLCLFISILNVSEVNAEEGLPDININYGENTGGSTGGNNGGNSGGNNGGNQGGGNNNNSGKWAEYPGPPNKKKILYQYSVSIGGGLSYRVIGANLDGNVGSNTAIKSGTWVGLNVHEVQRATWSVSNIQAKEVKKYFTCKKVTVTEECELKNEKGFRGDGSYGPIKVWRCETKTTTTTLVDNAPHDYYDGYTCPSEANQTYVEEKELPIGTPGYVKTKAYSEARNAALGLVGDALSKIQITTDDLNERNEYKTLTISAKLDRFDIPGVGPSGTITKEYIYKPDNICMNLRTGKVSYNKECTKEEEAQLNPYIYNGVSYWQYFSPLDAKSGTSFGLIIKNNSQRKLSNSECHSMMDTYKDKYQNYITSLSGRTLSGDYCRNGNCNNLNKGSGSDWQEVSKGCYFSVVVNFNMVQKYYYEEMKNNQLTFNGYNIYYRSINIDNPFPNTPTKNSLWYDWYNSTNKNPNLKDSFKEMTYSVAVSNKLADTIRAYNVNNPYPSFDKLSLAGESEFLRSIGVNSLTNDKYYKLGGGSKTCIKDKKVSIGSDCS